MLQLSSFCLIHTKNTFKQSPRLLLRIIHSLPSHPPLPASKNRPLSDRPSPSFSTPGPDLHGTLNAAPGSSDLTATSIPRCDFLLHFTSLFFSSHTISSLSHLIFSSSFSLLLHSPAKVGGFDFSWILDRVPCIVVLRHADIARTAQISGGFSILTFIHVDVVLRFANRISSGRGPFSSLHPQPA